MIPRKINLANIPTPVQQISFNGCKFLIKRDDYTGLELSGNKVRKLEYLLYDAKKKKADYIFTCGGEQSNHCRATAIAAASLGIKVKLFLWGKDSTNAEGNLFLNKLVGAEIKFLSKKEYNKNEIIMKADKDEFKSRGLNAYIIPEGGSNALGIWGYINFINEFKSQVSKSKIKGLITAAGSGGTAAGLLIGSHLNNWNLKIFIVNVLYSSQIIRERVNRLVEQCKQQFKIKGKIDTSRIEILDGYSSEGYKNISVEKIQVIKSFASSSGIILDTAYTGKAFYAYNENFLKGRSRTDILFIHTGGLFGAFNKRKKLLSA